MCVSDQICALQSVVRCDSCWGFAYFLTDSSPSLLSPQVATGKEGLSLASSSCPIAARIMETVRKNGFSKALTTPTIIAWIKCLLCARDKRHIHTPTPDITSSSHFCLISRQIELFLNIVDGLLHFFALWLDLVHEVLACSSRQLLVIAYSEANLG